MPNNTGYKAFANRRRVVNGVPDGYVEPNNPTGGIGPYIPPVYDITSCPLPTTTTTTASPQCITPIIVSVTKNQLGELIIDFSLNGGNPNATTIQYSTDGVNFGNNSTGSPVSPRNLGPATNFPQQMLWFRLKAECSGGGSGWSNIVQFNNVATNSYSISYTNNNSSQQIQVLIGNNNSAPSNTVYNGLYVSDPVVGTNSNLPATNAIVVLVVPGQTILNATCNGVVGTGTGNSRTWTGVNGPLVINFVTSNNSGVQVLMMCQNQTVYVNPPNTDVVTGAHLYIDAAMTTPYNSGGNDVSDSNGIGYSYNNSTGQVGNPTGYAC